jgi:hypothetical protein
MTVNLPTHRAPDCDFTPCLMRPTLGTDDDELEAWVGGVGSRYLLIYKSSLLVQFFASFFLPGMNLCL